MVAECLVKFLDLETGEVRDKGERFETTPERLSAINSTKYGQLAAEVEEKAAEAASAPQKPRRRARKTKE